VAIGWSDEFDTDSLDKEKWSYLYGTGAEQGLTGWGNNELQYYTDHEENIFIEDGKLHIQAREENYENMKYTSARIRTIGKGDWLYGRIEIRAMLPNGQGIWPAIWMLPTDEDFGGWPKSGEIDIMEMVGHEPATIHGTVHYGPDWPNNQYTGSPYTLDESIFYR
jgi:beta-glucanase (GH16 family)